MIVVVGTAGHIDHGKTTLLRALTGIDADRLPEERQRGMTIDVGYAHMALPDGDELDFVDVPGHDRLIGNMLVGAGEIDAALLVVAADDGPREQTREHLALLDALDVRRAIAVVTKADLVDAERAAEVTAAVGALLARTRLAGSAVLVASAERGDGLDELRAGLAALRDSVVAAAGRARPARLAVDRVFRVRGRGIVVTGSLRGGALERGTELRVEPGEGTVRVREIQVHGRSIERVGPGRTAVNLAGDAAGRIARGSVLAAGPDVVASSRLLVALTGAARLDGADDRAGGGLPPHGARLRLHLGTDQVDAVVSRAGRDAVDLPGGGATAVVRLDRAVAAAVGDRFVLRRPSPGAVAAGGVVLDPLPARGVSRRRSSAARLGSLAEAVRLGDGDTIVGALVELHGALSRERLVGASDGRPPGAATLSAGRLVLAADVASTLAAGALEEVAHHHATRPLEVGIPVTSLRENVALRLRRAVSADRSAADLAAAAFVDALCASGRLARTGDRIREPGREPALPTAVREAMDRLEAGLDSASPPSLAVAAAESGCPPDGIRALEAAGRIVRLGDDLAFAATAFERLESLAAELAADGPLTPAAYRDAIGSSRKYVMALLEEFGRRGVLVRGADGHRPGPRSPRGVGAGG